jgi:hypothetical protein
VVHLVRAALARVPFDAAPGLTWSDYLPPRWARAPGLRAAWDVVAPFLPASGLEMRYRLEARAAGVDVVGASLRTTRGQPVVSTRAELRRGTGIARLEVRAFGRLLAVERVARAPETQPEPPSPGLAAWLRNRSSVALGSPRAGGSS